MPRRSACSNRPARGGCTVVDRGGEFVFGGHAVVDRNDPAARGIGETAADHIVRFEVAQQPATAVILDQRRQPFGGRCRSGGTAARGYHPGDRGGDVAGFRHVLGPGAAPCGCWRRPGGPRLASVFRMAAGRPPDHVEDDLDIGIYRHCAPVVAAVRALAAPDSGRDPLPRGRGSRLQIPHPRRESPGSPGRPRPACPVSARWPAPGITLLRSCRRCPWRTHRHSCAA